MALRYFRNGPARALAFPLVNGTDTAVTVDSASGFPIQFPYTIILDPDQSTEEVCDVTGAVGNVLTITRGVDSTTAVAHGAGTVVYHGVSARDPREANEHVNAVTNVHGTTGGLVDTDSVQNIPGRKIFDDAESTGGGNFVDVAAPQTITGLKTFTQTPTTTTNGDLATLGGAQTFTGAKTFQNTVYNGTEDHNGAEDHSGAEVHSGTESHAGVETHTGTIRFSHADMVTKSDASTVDDSTTSTTFVATGDAASPKIGKAFNAPPSGSMLILLGAYFLQTTNTESAFVSFGVRTGAVVGAGVDVLVASTDRALVVGDFVSAGAPDRMQATRAFLVTGLTPGTSYNAVVEFSTTAGGGIQVFYRDIIIKPEL